MLRRLIIKIPFYAKVLERTEEEEKEKSVDLDEKPFVLGEDEKKSDEKDTINTAEEGKPLELTISKEQMELQKKAKEYLAAKNGDLSDLADTGSENANQVKVEDGETKKKGRKRKRTKEFDDDSSEESSEDEADDDVPPGINKKTADPEKKDGEIDDVNKGKDLDPEHELKEESKDEENDKVGESDTKELDKKEGDTEKEVPDDNKTENNSEDGKLEEVDGMKPRPLHKVTSIFLRNLSPTITKQEVEAMCRRYPGFLRAAIADPSPERRWFRRGWVTFERDIKIKDICFNLNNIRLRYELV